ncbi:uncharacterized protein [Heterodontus francisci]|uniref:uncharacterized protein isoform X2 n=1 Tax=Heterodontus francisci TaxID=7792 RepID=UPI00355B2E5E
MRKLKKEKKQDVSIIIQRFLKSYERHCAQTLSAVSSMLVHNLQKCIENEEILTKLILARPEATADDLPPVILKPLLMTIRDERYMYGKELCVWRIALDNQDVANLAIVLELRGRTSYPFSKIELVDCGIDTWSIERLGKAVSFSALTCIVLDYNEPGEVPAVAPPKKYSLLTDLIQHESILKCCFFRRLLDEGLRGLCHGLKENGQLLTLSMCYCNLGPPSGSLLGDLVAITAIRNLFLDGNNLQCEGACELIKFIADYAENVARKKFGASLHSEEDPSNFLEATETSALQSIMSSQGIGHNVAIDGEDVMNSNVTQSKKKKKGKKKKDLPQIAPWLSKLHLADNGIDGKGNESRMGPMMFTEMLCQLIKFSDHLTELDLDDNCLGELCGKEILDALRERKEAKLQSLKIKVTAQMNAETFSNILKHSKKVEKAKKKKKKKK